MSGVETITLDSCTVFWEDIMSARVLADLRRDDRKGNRVMDDFKQWLDENAEGDWRDWEKGIWFARSIDAVHFKLAWAGEVKA